MPPDGGHQLGAQCADHMLHLLRPILPHVLLQQHRGMDTQGTSTTYAHSLARCQDLHVLTGYYSMAQRQSRVSVHRAVVAAFEWYSGFGAGAASV